MDRRDDQHRKNDDPIGSQIPPQLPPETYNHLIHALLSLQESASQNRPPTYPIPSYPPPNYGHPANAHLPPTLSVAGPSTHYPTNPPILVSPHAVSQIAGPSQLTASTATAAPTAQDPESLEDAISIAEDKRRRNTAASARFRVKRKLKTLNLERTVTDLTGRTEELEREAADLRRENTWLKDIVVLKGRNLTAAPSASVNRQDDDGKDGSESETGHRREKGKERAR